jgi:hypothetical protein
MRRLLFIVAVTAFAGCGNAKAAGPKWPAPSTTAEDGGESLEPKPTATYAAALEKSAEAEEKKPEAKDTEDKPAATTTDEKPATTPTTEDKPATTDDVMMTEEIVIEIEE